MKSIDITKASIGAVNIVASALQKAARERATSEPAGPAKVVDAVANGSAFRFRLSAKYPPTSDSIGGTFVDGEIKCDVADLPEVALRVLKDLVRERDMEGQTHIEFTISPNTTVRHGAPEPSTPDGRSSPLSLPPR